MENIMIENYNFTLHKDINGPVLAVAVGIVFILSLAINLFVLIFTLCYPKTLKQPSIIFLTNFILNSLLETLLVMPFMIVTASAGEVVHGKTVEERNHICQFQGFIFAFGIQQTMLTLTVISVDRFLFIVKPFVYKHYINTWVAVLIIVIVWVFAALINIPPYFGLGQYAFGFRSANCVQVWNGHRDYVAYFAVILMISTVIMVVTSFWTFCFAKNFIRRIFVNAPSGNEDDYNQQKHLYTKRMNKLVGIFSMLIIVTVLTFTPTVIAGIIGVIIGSNNLPAPVFSFITISYLTNTVFNPIIQIYFRKDMNEYIVDIFQRMKNCRSKTNED